MDIEQLKKQRWILLPGTLCTAEVFDGFLNLVGVTEDHRYAVPINYAQIDEYLPVINGFMRPDDVICGFSLGAIVAAHLADRINASAMLLFGLNPFADDPEKAEDRHSLAASVRREGGRAALSSRLPPILGPSPYQVTQQILCMAESTADCIDEQTALALNRPGALPALADSCCSIHLLTGSKDASAPFAYAQAAAEVAPHAQAHAIEGLGHYALLENPQLCYQSLKNNF